MKENFKKKVLKNGLTILFEKRDVPVVSVSFSIRQGGVNEAPEERGISHFIEHMLYKGTKNRNAKEIAQEVEKNGGELDGFTSEEITSYWCKMPSRNLKIALEVLSDLIKNPLFNEKEIEKERKVIFEEMKMHQDNPMKYVLDEIQRHLYEGNIAENLAGTFKILESIGRKELVQKFKEVYTPNNIILTVVGDASFNEIVKFAEENFGNEKGSIPKQEFGLKNEVKEEKREGVDQANMVLAYHVPLANDPKHYAARVLSAVMAEGMSSRLFTEIREKRNLAYVIQGGANISKDFAHNLILAGTTKENVPLVKKLILEEFKKVGKDLDEKELNQIKEQLIGHHQISMEDSQVQMIGLLSEELSGTVEDFYNFEEKIRKVKLEDVKKMARGVKEGKYSFFALVPK